MLLVALLVCYMDFLFLCVFFHGCSVATLCLHSTGLTLLFGICSYHMLALNGVDVIIWCFYTNTKILLFFHLMLEIKYFTLLIQETFDPEKLDFWARELK